MKLNIPEHPLFALMLLRPSNTYMRDFLKDTLFGRWICAYRQTELR